MSCLVMNHREFSPTFDKDHYLESSPGANAAGGEDDGHGPHGRGDDGAGAHVAGEGGQGEGGGGAVAAVEAEVEGNQVVAVLGLVRCKYRLCHYEWQFN